MYLGETDIKQERIDKFLEFARDLHITEFMSDLKADQASEEVSVDPDLFDYRYESSDNLLLDKIDESNDPYIPGYDDTGEKLDSDMFYCETCGKVFKHKGDMKRHQESRHKGIRYSCNQCEYQATKQQHLKTHQQSMHVGIRFFCDQCDYQAKLAHQLKTHKKITHEGVRFDCDQCEYHATQFRTVKRHKQSTHDGVKYSCNTCEYQTGREDSLQGHVQRKHSKLQTVQ